MRRKTIIVLAITFMVTVMATASSYLYISKVLRDRITYDYEDALRLNQHLIYLAAIDLPDLTSTRVDTSNPVAMRRAIAENLGVDTNLMNNMSSAVALWPYISDAAVVDANGKILLHNVASSEGKQAPERPKFQQVKAARFLEQLRVVYSPGTTYEVSSPLWLNGVLFGTVRIGVSTTLLKSETTQPLIHAAYFSVISIFASLLLAAGISNLALGPLKQINLTLDNVSLGAHEELSGEESEHDEFGLVTLKIANLGRQMRDSREIFSALKDNVEQLMSTLQDGLMLFTRDSRVVLVSAPVERFLGRPRAELLGKTAREIFFRDSPLGIFVLDSFERKHPLPQREFVAAAGRHVQVSLDFVQEKNNPRSALSSSCATRNPSAASAMKSRCPAGSPPAGASPVGSPTKSRIPSTPSSFTCNFCRISWRSLIPIPAATWTSSAAKSTASTA